MTWGNPWFLLALVIPLGMAVLFIWRERKKRALTVLFPDAASLAPLQRKSRRALRHAIPVLRIIAVALLVVALARPRTQLEEEKVTTEGIDIVIALDLSTSMLAEDLQPKNRITAAKKVAEEFINGRSSDRIGLVMFAGEAYTWCPLTLDYHVLDELMDKIEAGSIKDGTAIGKAIATGTNRLRSAEGKSKVLILITDGVNNVDQPDPLTAARAATALGIRIYTIGVGTQGFANAPVQTPFGIQMQKVKVEIDEELLSKVAEMSGGMYFRATTTEALREVYQRIDQLEKTKIDIHHLRHYHEAFTPWALIGLVLLLVERILGMSWMRNIAE